MCFLFYRVIFQTSHILYVLFVLKVEGNFRRIKRQSKNIKGVIFFIYKIDIKKIGCFGLSFSPFNYTLIKFDYQNDILLFIF